MMNSDGQIAVVTGASSGIGRAIAVESARRGFDIIATGRNDAALSDLADEILRLHERKVEVIVADLSIAADRRRLAETLASREVEILVNNAGSGIKGDFADTSIADETEMIDVQIVAMLELTKSVVPKMKARGSGRILNVSSVYAFAPVPQQSVYAAAKSFIYSFSASIRNELGKSGISVSVLAPGITRTAFRTRAGITDKPNSGLSAEAVAGAAVDGSLSGRQLIIPGIANRFFVFLSKHLPTSLTVGLINMINDRRGVRRS
jgi:short-subunit dehydrogenase